MAENKAMQQRLLRRQDVEKLMAMGAPSFEILAVITKKHNVVTRTVESDMHAVHKMWAKDAINTEERARAYDRNHRMAMQHYRHCLAKKDLTNATRALKLICEIDGLVGPGVQVNLHQNNNVTGVLVVPHEAPSVDAWLAKHAIDVESE